VSTDSKGNVDMAELKAKAEQHKDRLAALMVTYPSTHGEPHVHVYRACACVLACTCACLCACVCVRLRAG